jgi:hypothetical protein
MSTESDRFAFEYDAHVRICARCQRGHEMVRAGSREIDGMRQACAVGRLAHLRWCAAKGEVSPELLARGERTYGAEIAAEKARS